jgi:hypothetical protein
MKGAPVHVLIADTATPGGQLAAARLRGVGDVVFSCFDETTGSFCRGLGAEGCPLDGGIDVAVVVRPDATPEVLPREMTALCAFNRSVPIVIAGASADHPYSLIATADDEGSDVTAIVHTVAALPMVRHSAEATTALRDTLELRGVAPRGAWAEVHRDGARLAVRLNLPSDCPDGAVVGMAAVRVLAALTDVAPGVKSIDVSAHRLAGAA